MQESSVSLASLAMEVPLNVVMNISELDPKQHILELVPALKHLAERMQYVISSGNRNAAFRIQQRGGLSYLHAARHTAPPGTYTLEVSSLPLHASGQLQHANTQAGELGKRLHMRLRIQLQ